MDYIVTGVIVLGALALVTWRLVRFIRALVSPGASGPACGGGCSSCPAQGEMGTDDDTSAPPDSWQV